MYLKVWERIYCFVLACKIILNKQFSGHYFLLIKIGFTGLLNLPCHYHSGKFYISAIPR
ncbi:hypothetical protein SLEP1_g582 [Rubroshorea leprosula]|uniref:Uncharacterized protein n=1 Tax=Rubroshorea leprosula TaxID=152421 RepID=A0AAV5HFQ0_9ROSI|nr:hypothetical protein SLEP1_g582 [Rubroshorea leprosula]